jgi:hypothetical protein
VILAHDVNPWIGPAIVAAGIAALVSIVTVVVSGVLHRRDRQRQLIAEAFEKVHAYREFIFIVRRRLPESNEKAEEDRARISGELSQLQARINSLVAVLCIESPHVGDAYATLVQETRRIAGSMIRDAWTRQSTLASDTMNITDVDLTDLDGLDGAFRALVEAELALPPWAWWMRWRARSMWEQALQALKVSELAAEQLLHP